MTDHAQSVSPARTTDRAAGHDPAAPPGLGGSARLGWLDALRGYAALTVVCFHLGPYLLGPARHAAVLRHIDLGKYGVLLFFLVSGYVIPMSLERHGSLRRFWVGRLFRVYPAFLLAAAVMTALILAGVLPLTASLRAETVAGALGHATMLQELLGLRGVVRVFWTLSYEMIFYLIVAGLFAYRLHRRSAWWASGLVAVAVLAGGVLPDGLLTPGFVSRRVVAALLLLAVAGSVLAYLSGRRRATLAAGALGIGFVALPAVNGSPTATSTVVASWQALLLLAVMFAGTVVYHAQHSVLSRRAATVALSVVALGVVAGHWIHLAGEVASPAGVRVQRAVWVGTCLAVVATFAAAFAVRRRRVPRVLTFFGEISYSMYVLHAIVLLLLVNLLPQAYARPLPQRLTIAVFYCAVVLLVSWLSYRFVERPAQRWGHRVGAALDALLGPEAGGRSAVVRPRRSAPPGSVAATVRAGVRTGRR